MACRRPFTRFGRHRLQRRLDVARLRGRRVFRRAPGRPLRPSQRADRRRRVFPRFGAGARASPAVDGLRHLPRHRRPGRGCGQRDVAGLHQRGLAGALSRPAGDRAADRDHLRPVLRRSSATTCWRGRRFVDRAAVVGFEAWRWMFWIEMFPAALFLLPAAGIPESPRYLVVEGAHRSTHAVLTRLYGATVARLKLGEIEASLAQDHHRPRLSRPVQTRRPADPPDRLGRHRPGHVPATGRHQRGVLLRRRAVAGGRVLRERCVADQRAVRRAEHRRLPGAPSC